MSDGPDLDVQPLAAPLLHWRHGEDAPRVKLNIILWQDAMGDVALPAQLYEKRKPSKDDDD